MRCLVIRLSSLGDIILTTPVIESLAESRPDIEIHFAVSARYADVLTYFPRPVVKHVFAGRTRADFLQFAAQFTGQQFDVVFDLHANWRSRMLVHRIEAHQVHAYPGDVLRRWSIVYLKRGFGGARHVVDRYLETVRKSGIPVTTSVPRLVATAQDTAAAETELRRRGWSPDRSAIGIGWGARWPAKKVPVKLWGELAERLKAASSLALAIFAPAQDEPEVTQFAEQCGGGNIFPFIGMPFPEVLGAINFCRAFVSSDSGLMHTAAALGVPTVGIFGPTHPALGFAPLGPGSRAVHSGIFCSPCSRHGRTPCYRGHRFCFDEIDIEALAQLVHSRVQRSPGE